MKKLLLLIAPLVVAASLSFITGDPLSLGSMIPKADIKMKNVAGKMVSIKEVAKAKGTLVMFSCNTCPYVLKNQKRIVAINDFALKMKVGVIVLNSNEAYRNEDDSYEAMQAYAKDQKYNWDYVVDKNHEVADAFGAKRTPEVFLFNKEGKLVYHGAIDDNPSDATNVNRQHLKEAIKELVAGNDITVKESRSVGCSIKRKK